MTRFVSKRLLVTVLLFLLCSLLASSQTPTNTTVYVYDELGRLKAVITSSGEAAVYSYDAAGNITSITRRTAGEVSIIQFTPDSGSIGTSVTIYGTGFSTDANQNTIQFNGVSAPVISASATQLVTSVPAGASTGPISVITPTGSATSTSPFDVNLLAPTITGFSPTIGVASNINGANGTAVTINGTNFDNTASNNHVKFNVVDARTGSADAATITTSVPYSGTSGRISVETANGVAVSTDDFFVPPPPFVPADVVFTGRMAIGETKTVTIGTANKIGLLLFDGVIGQSVSINISGVTIGNSNVTIYQPNGSVLLTATSITSSGQFIDTRELTATGTYTILIDPTFTNIGNMTFALNGIIDVTGTIEVGGPSVTTTTTVAGQNAQLTFNGVQGQRLGLNLTGVTISNSNVSIINPDGTFLVAATPVTTSGRFIETPALPAGGLYTILIDPLNAVVGSMTLTLNAVPPDVNATIAAGGPPVTVTTVGAGQNARVTFAGNANQRVSLLLDAVTISSSTVSILKPDGSILVTAATVGTVGWFFESQTLPVTGTYTILVDPKAAATGSMTLTLYDVSVNVTGTITIGGPPVTVTINVPGENGQLTFTGTAGQIVYLEVWGTLSYNSLPHIVNPDGSSLVSNFGFEANGYRLPVTGTYTIPIDPAGDSTGESTFALYEIPPPVTASLVADGPPVRVTIPTASQMANITFSGTAGQRVSIRISDIDTGPYAWYSWVEVVKPDGSYLADEFAYPEGYFDDGFLDKDRLIDTITLPVTGTYTINVYPEFCSGSYTFTLFNVPPDVTATIAPDGVPVTVTTTVPGQDAVLTFSGTAGQRVSLKTTQNIFPYSAIDIISPSGSFIGGFSPTGLPGHIGFEDAIVLPSTGTYKIVVNAYFAFAGTTTLQLFNVPAPSTVGTLTFNGPPVTFTTTVPGHDVDMTFSGTAGQRISLKMIAPLDSDFIIRRPNNQTLVSSKFAHQLGNIAGDLFETIVLPTTGTYKVTVNTWFTVGDISVNLYEVPPDIDDGAITIGGPPVTLTSTATRQNRRLTFEGTQGQVLHLVINNNGSLFNHEFVNQPNGTVWTRRLADNAAVKVLGLGTLPATGTYTILTELYGLNDSVTLTLREGLSDVTGVITADGQPTVVTVPAARQRANYTFQGNAGQRMTLKSSDVTFGTGSVSMSGTEVDCCGQQFVGGDLITPERFNVRDLTTTGTQSILVTPNFDFTGSVTLRLLPSLPDITGSITANGASVNLTTVPGQNAVYTIQGTSGQRLTLHFTNNTIGKMYVEIISPTGSSQGFHVNGGSSFDVPTQVLPLPGTYTIRIDPYRTAAGSVTFSVTSP